MAGIVFQGRRLLQTARQAPPASVELGAPPTWPQTELARVQGEAHRLTRAQAPSRALPATAALIALAAGWLFDVPILTPVGAIALLLLAWRWWAAPSPYTGVLHEWHQWAAARRSLEQQLRLLGPDWRLLWDRRLEGLPSPAIVAVGPPGVWAAWLAEPELQPRGDVQRAADCLVELTSLSAGCHGLSPTGVEQFVQRIATGPVLLGAEEIARGAEQLDWILLQEPVHAPAAAS